MTSSLEQAIATALPLAYRDRAASLARIVMHILDEPDAVDAAREMLNDPYIASAAYSLRGRTIDAGVTSIRIDGDAGVVQAITLSGGQVRDIIGRQVINIALVIPPVGVDHESALRLLETLPPRGVPQIASLPAGSRVLQAPNAQFVGRRADLLWLAATLRGRQPSDVGQVAALVGIGGIGKTSIALEFVHRYGQYFAGGVFWVNCIDPANVASEIAVCGGSAALSIPGIDEMPLAEQVSRTLSAWREPTPRLIVFDNCEDEALFAQWRPVGGGSRVLITSRRAEWRPDLGVTTREITVLERAKSRSLLRSYCRTITPEEASAIADRLGRLPLALHLAGRFLARFRATMAPKTYLDQLQQSIPLYRRPPQRESDTLDFETHLSDVGRSFALSYQRLDDDLPLGRAARLALARAACCASGEPIPRELLISAVAGETDAAARALAEDGISRLCELGLLARDNDTAVTIHSLVSVFVRQVVEDTTAQLSIERALCDWFRHRRDASGRVAPLTDVISHFRAAVAVASQRADLDAVVIMNNLGYYLKQLGELDSAQSLYEQALSVTERFYGQYHRATGICYGNLGDLFRLRKDYSRALWYQERALSVSRSLRGLDNPDTARNFNNLAAIHRDQGNQAFAKELFQRAFDIRFRIYGNNHIDTAVSYINLATIALEERDDVVAEEYFGLALKITEFLLGDNHITLVHILASLAELYFSKRNIVQAQVLLQRAVNITEQSYGRSDPRTARIRQRLLTISQ